jgi:hypothetical protein
MEVLDFICYGDDQTLGLSGVSVSYNLKYSRVWSVNTQLTLLSDYKCGDMFRLTESSSGQSLNHISLGTLSKSAHFWDSPNVYNGKKLWIQVR